MIMERQKIDALVEQGQRLWSWWIDELRACVPARVRDRFAGARTDLYPSQQGVEIICRDGNEERRFKEDKPLAQLDDHGWEELTWFLTDRTARILLAPQDIFCFKLDLPRRTGRNLPATIALQLEFASPLEPSYAAWSWAILRADRDRVEVLVAEAKLSYLTELSTLFERRGLRRPPVYCETELGLVKLQDGCSQFRSVEGRRDRRVMFACLIIVAALPVILFLGAQFLIARNEAKLDLVRREIAPRLEADRETRRQARLWRAWEPFDRLAAASIILGDLGQRAPDGVSVENISVTSPRKINFELAGATDAGAVEAMIGSDGLLTINDPATERVEGAPVTLSAEMP